MAILDDKPLTPFFLRLTHTGVHRNGSPNLSSVPLYDLEVGFEYGTRKQTIYVPVGGYVDLPIAPRVLLALSAGTIGILIRDGILGLDIVARFRDITDCGGPAGTGVPLAATAPNIERTGDVLSFVIEVGDDIEGFIAGEKVNLAGLGGAFAGLDGDYTIATVTLGAGIGGPDDGLYHVTVESEGPDIAGAGLAGVTASLPDGKVNVELHSSGGLSGLGSNVHSYVAGDAIVTNCVVTSGLKLINPSDGSSVKPNTIFFEEGTGNPYWKDGAGVLHPLVGSAVMPGVRAYQFSADFAVPVFGTLYLQTGDVPTSSAPLIVDRAAKLTGATLSVDRPDSSRTFQLEVLVNGTLEETLPLALSTSKAVTIGFAKVLAALDEIQIRLVRLTGTGKSTFRNVAATLTYTET